MQSNLTCSLGYATILETIALTDIIELLTVTWPAIVKQGLYWNSYFSIDLNDFTYHNANTATSWLVL